MSVWFWTAVAALGALGAATRFALDSVITSRAGRQFPLGTLTINVTGAFLLGLLAGLAVSGDLLLLVGGAALGSYTTFSAWMFGTYRLAQDGAFTLAILNVVVTLAVGIGAAALGTHL